MLLRQLGPSPTSATSLAAAPHGSSGSLPTTALDRTRALRDRGVIRGAVLDVHLPSIGRAVQALIAVRIRPPSRKVIEAFRDWATSRPQTLGVFVTTGTEDFIIHVAVADVRTSVVYEHIRSTRVEPVGDPGTAVGPGTRR